MDDLKLNAVIDNFKLLFYEKDLILGDEDELNDGVLFRRRVNEIFENIKRLRDEIEFKNQARRQTDEKLKMQLRDSRNQTRHFGMIDRQSTLLQAIDSNYKRLKLLYEKIYILQVQLQELYIELLELIDKRSESIINVHKISRQCANILYEYKTSFNI